MNKDSSGIDIVNRGFARMLSDDTAEKLKQFHTMHCMHDYGTRMRNDDQGPRGLDPPVIPYAPSIRARIFTGTHETGVYNHHSQINKFKGKYYFAWSNGIIDEDTAGQRILISSSDDAIQWSQPTCVAGDKNAEIISLASLGLFATEEKLYLLGGKVDAHKEATQVGMRRFDPESQELGIYSSDDGKKWEYIFTFNTQIRGIFEDPRPTKEGNLLCVASTKDGPAILRWPGTELCEAPEIILIPQPHGSAFPYGESSWYQTDDGTIIIFWRDEGCSCRLWVNFSTDGGLTFSEPCITDIPDSMSRVYAGRLDDGRYFLCNNAYQTLLNRMHLFLLLSDDGYVFNKVYMVIDDPTEQRLKGLLKLDGYQYPCCLADGNKLLIGYSINKEDIECSMIDMTKL
jgi:hypothetical protein